MSIIAKGTAKRFAKRLLREHRKGRSYRTIAREDYPTLDDDGELIVKFGTLNRIAISRGEWFPKDRKILVALGLKKPLQKRVPEPIPEWLKRIKKHIATMRADTRKAVIR